ncbi:MAG: RDD family protein [bacterium]
MENSPSCENHPQRPARWFCWDCGKSLCEECAELRSGQYYCKDCLPEFEFKATSADTAGEGPKWPDIHYEANLLKRLLAFEIDFVILIFTAGLLSSLVGIIFQFGVSASQKVFLFLFYGGLLIRDGLFLGGSPGKSILKLYVWNQRDDRPVSFLDSILRNLFFPVFYFDFLTIPFSPERQRAGDILAGTVVYDQKYRVEEKKYIYYTAGITSLLLAGLVVIFVSWFAAEMRYRVPSLDFNGREIGKVKSIKKALEKAGRPAAKFQVNREGARINITGEYPDADSYYRAKSDVVNLLESNSYKIIEIQPPKLVLRGPDKRRYKLTIEAEEKSKGGN